MADVRGTNCCGVREITWLSGHTGRPKNALRSILLQSLRLRADGVLDRPDFAFYTFTQAHITTEPARREAYGDQLKAAIERYGLGTVTVTAPVKNRGSGNYVKVYVWAVDWPAVLRFSATL
jgi:hypothetical protein